MKNLLFLFPVFLLSSCFVFHSGNFSSGPLIKPGDKVIGTASGTARSMFVFGIGDLSNDHLIKAARENMYSSSPLTGQEYFSNFTCDVSHQYILGVISIIKVTVSAKILRPESEASLSSAGAGNKKRSLEPGTYFVNAVDTFNVGESVFYEAADGTCFKYTISSITDNKITLGGSNLPQLNLSPKQIEYSTKKSAQGYKPGDKVKVKYFLKTETATVAALNSTKAVLFIDGSYYAIKISKLNR